jgi:hypothetical protein
MTKHEKPVAAVGGNGLLNVQLGGFEQAIDTAKPFTPQVVLRSLTAAEKRGRDQSIFDAVRERAAQLSPAAALAEAAKHREAARNYRIAATTVPERFARPLLEVAASYARRADIFAGGCAHG